MHIGSTLSIISTYYNHIISSMIRYVKVTLILFLLKPYLVGGFNPSEKYESQLGWWHSQYMEKCSILNHQPDIVTIKYLLLYTLG